MDGSVSLSVKDRKALVWRFRAGITPEALRAVILLLAAQGLTYLIIQSLLGVSSRTVSATKDRWSQGVMDLHLNPKLSRMDGKMNEALKTIEEVIPHIPESPVVYLTRGSTYLNLGRYPEAVDDLKRVVDAEPFNERAHFKLSEAYRSMKNLPQSQEHMQLGVAIRAKRQRIIDLSKEWQAGTANESATEELAKLHQELGQVGEAQRWQGIATRLSQP